MNAKWLAFQSLLYTVAILWQAGLIDWEGKLFSSNLHYRSQVEAFLNGELAISRNPAHAVHDLTWSEGGVHQVWGLGVPLWRLPWDLAAKLAGLGGFPDVLALALAMTGVCWFAMRTVYLSQSASVPIHDLHHLVTATGIVVLVFLFPPFMGLLGTRFDIYEEAVIYGYLYTILLLFSLLRLLNKPTWPRFWLLCLLAGLGGLVRPTVVFYSFTTVGAAIAVMVFTNRCSRTSHLEAQVEPKDPLFKALWRPMALGLSLFCLGGGVLYSTNLARFGSGFEFGHRLNLQHLYGSMYATRFDHPFQNEPLWSATKEMCGLLFFTREMSGGDFYKRNFFPGQSRTIRWREVYLSAYNWRYLLLLLGGGLAGVLALKRIWRAWRGSRALPQGASNLDIALLAVWGGSASLLLFAFYLRNSVISSRYLLDFMPGFVALIAAGWLAWCQWWGRRDIGKYAVPLSILALCGWLLLEMTQLRTAYGLSRLQTWTEVERRIERQMSKTSQPHTVLPSIYDTSTRFEDYQIPYNGAGWTPKNGMVKPLIILFMEDPQYLELTVRHDSPGWETEPPQHVRAKIGLEFLERESVTKGDEGWVVRFRGPRARRYQHGLQVGFVVFVPNTHLAEKMTYWRLLKAQWKDLQGHSDGTDKQR